MKTDVLNDFDSIKICVAYRINGETVVNFPYDICDGNIEPVYVELSGWKQDLNTLAELPLALKRYVDLIETQVGTPITMVSIGPDRKQTIQL
jgi:adenylosuccinate synthase